MFKFELNNVRIPKIRAVGSSGTDTTWIGTGTIHVLVSGTGTTLDGTGTTLDGTGTTLDGTGTILVLHKWYRYHPCLVPIPDAGTAQKLQILPFLPHFSSIQLLNCILHQNPP